MNVSIHDSDPPSRAITARRWGRMHGREAVEWMHASGVVDRMLADICAAVEQTVDWVVGDDTEMARQVLEQYPQVLNNCDKLDFGESAQALAYLILHLPDRYTRAFQVLERLLISGALPLGKKDSFAAIDIGAGPGPAMFAIRNFYAALARYASLHDSSWPISTLGRSNVVERSPAMPWIMHWFAEALVMAEQADRVELTHAIDKLRRSRPPFGANHDDFSTLDVNEMHHSARHRRAQALYNDDSWELTRAEAYRMAYEEPATWPSGYSLAVMMNFLTTVDAVPQFSGAIDRLMRGALVPGGAILVIGATNSDYEAIYRELDRRAKAIGLKVLDGFDEPLQAGSCDIEHDMLCALTRAMWQRLELLAGDTSQIKRALSSMHAADIYDESKSFRLPKFRVRAYRRGR